MKKQNTLTPMYEVISLKIIVLTFTLCEPWQRHCRGEVFNRLHSRELQLLLAHVQLHQILPKESEQSMIHQHMLVDESHIVRDSNRNQLHTVVKRIAVN